MLKLNEEQHDRAVRYVMDTMAYMAYKVRTSSTYAQEIDAAIAVAELAKSLQLESNITITDGGLVFKE